MSDTAVLELPVPAGVEGAQPPRGWLRMLLAPLRILTKEGDTVRLDQVWNYAQLDFIDEVERQIVETGQVRICVLKARQIGISTIIEAIIFLFSVMLDDLSSLVISHENDSAEHLLGMTTRYWETFIHQDHFQTKYKGKAQLAWDGINSGVKIKTAENVKAGRSNTIHCLHASEVAFWPDPNTLMTGLRQSIPSFGLTMIFLESTANGIGNYFHTQCMKAMRGETEFTFKFYPWHEHPEYTATYLASKHRSDYALIGELDEEEQWLRDVLGISDERLVWRRYAIANLCDGDVSRFHQEYPTTPHEAFVSTGRNVFPLRECLNHYRPLRGKRGVLQRNDQTRKIEFIPRSDGWLTVYSYPSPDKSWGVYVGGGDPTHTTTGDNAVCQVLNRRTLEQVAVYRNKIDPIRFGKHMQLIGAWYNDALLAPEREGPGYATVGCIAADGYVNLYQSSNPVSAQGKIADAYGWSTNSQTKKFAISHLLKQITEPLSVIADTIYGLVIHDELTLMEMRDYVTSEDGKKYQNANGSEYDDGVMSLAIAVTVHETEPPPPPYTSPSPLDVPPNTGTRPLANDPDPDDDDDPTDEPAPVAPWEMWSQTHRRE